MQDDRKLFWSSPYVSVVFFPSLKQNFIAYRSSKVSSHPDCIFEIHQLWQSGFSRVYSICCCSCWFEREIIKIGQSSHKIYSKNVVNFQVYDNFKCLYKRSLETYWMHHITARIDSKSFTLVDDYIKRHETCEVNVVFCVGSDYIALSFDINYFLFLQLLVSWPINFLIGLVCLGLVELGWVL